MSGVLLFAGVAAVVWITTRGAWEAPLLTKRLDRMAYNPWPLTAKLPITPRDSAKQNTPKHRKGKSHA